MLFVQPAIIHATETTPPAAEVRVAEATQARPNSYSFGGRRIVVAQTGPGSGSTDTPSGGDTSGGATGPGGGGQ